MEFLEYLKEKIIFMSIQIATLAFSAILLNALNVGRYAIVFVSFLNFISGLIFYLYDYLNKNKYYKYLYDSLNSLDKKYLISEIIDEPSFLDGKILCDILSQTDKAMNDRIGIFKNENKEYKEYIELWIHEIKTPLSAIKLLTENHKNKITDSIEEEAEKLENYIEQVLYYTKSNYVEKDYIIRKFNIKASINQVIKRNANILIEKRIGIMINDIDKSVYSDKKWIEFILHQIISNSIKYMDKEEKVLEIFCNENESEVSLHIKDNGIGMDEKTLTKAFDKGYTGENGRKFSKSTGFGLYLCKKLCNNLGLSIGIKSKEKDKTEVIIRFHKNNMVLLE